MKSTLNMVQIIGNVSPQVMQRGHMVKNGTADTIVHLESGVGMLIIVNSVLYQICLRNLMI